MYSVKLSLRSVWAVSHGMIAAVCGGVAAGSAKGDWQPLHFGTFREEWPKWHRAHHFTQ